MFSKSYLSFVVLSVLSVSDVALGRYRWMERDNKAVFLHPRRFGQEHPAVLDQLSQACPSGSGVCATLAGQAISTLLAGAAECDQQDFADQIIDAAAQFDAETQQNIIQLAVQFRQAEKNTPPDFTTNPPTNRNSVFCQKAPANAQLNDLVQAQDPANDPNIFFDPATKQSVQKGDQPNTFPFGTPGSDDSDATSDPAVTVSVNGQAAATSADSASVAAQPAATAAAASNAAAASGDIGNFGSCSVPQIEFGVGFDGRKETSFQPADKASFNHGSAQNIDIISKFICDTLTNSCNADATAKATCAQAQSAADAQTPKTGAQADAFNAVFGVQTNFAAVSEVDDQGNVVAGTGSAAASGTPDEGTPDAAPPTPPPPPAVSASDVTAAGGAASSSIGNFGSCSVPEIEFGAGFDGRKETSFQPVDKASFNHGSAQNIDVITQSICDTLTNSCKADATAKATCAQAQQAADAQPPKTGAQADAFNAVFGIQTNFASVAAVDDTGKVIAGSATKRASSIGNFGSCSVPEIDFGVGFDGRKETSFQPADKASFNHGSAQNIDIISKFICDTLTNSCGADATAKATCAQAQSAADAQTPKTGAQADAFNAVFGIQTNFDAVAEVDDQGNVVAGTGSAAAQSSSAAVDANSDNAGASASDAAAASGASSAIGDFGSCSVPEIEFGVGFDGRKETSFQPADKASFNHGSAQNIDIISKFICDTLTNSCGADATAKATCAQAQSAADAQTPKTGAQADAFNAVFGIQSNFAAVAEVDDQGNVVAGTGSAAAASDSAGAAAGAANAAAGASNAAAGSGASSAIGNFGSCSVPEIEFGVGFDGRKETSFQPADKASFNHGSAQNIDIISKFICDTLTNSCDADATAKATCAQAQAAADAQTPKTGAQADAFNAVFGIQTKFAAVAEVDDQGNVVAAKRANNIGDFGSCSVPEIDFGVGFDNRKETSFQPADKASFNHGSAQNIDIISKFICDTLTNSCGADATAKATCAQAQKAADAQTPKTGAQADAFNAVFGIQTNFAATAAVDDQGNVIAGTATKRADQNLQTFTGDLGGISPPPVTKLANGQFQVDGNSAFKDLKNALVRSCDVQHNQCANAANKAGNSGDFNVQACADQQTDCDNVANEPVQA